MTSPASSLEPAAPSPARVFGLLAREALADATRRRIVPLIAAMALLSLLFVNSCTSCSPEIQMQGQSVQAAQVTGVLGVAVILVLGLWTVVLAGVLASDHLAEPISDGSAALVLSRPVSRAAFALSRLAGVLSLSFGTGAVLLCAAAVLLAQRQGLPPGPVLVAALACAASCVSVGALAMAASLFLPRVATALLVFGLVWGVALLNVFGRSGAELSGWLGGLDRYGPPLASSMIVALWPWIEPLAAVPGGALADVALRGGLWAAASATLVVLAFRRLEVS